MRSTSPIDEVVEVDVDADEREGVTEDVYERGIVAVGVRGDISFFFFLFDIISTYYRSIMDARTACGGIFRILCFDYLLLSINLGSEMDILLTASLVCHHLGIRNCLKSDRPSTVKVSH